jgi:replicative DNA helicase
MNPELAQYEALAKDILRRVMAEEDPADLRQWISDTLLRLGGGDENAVMTWEQSFDLFDRMMEEFKANAQNPGNKPTLEWPWASWRKLIDPLEKGMLAVVTAPDGQGKTIYGEEIAEHWAKKGNRIVFVHFELNRELMLERRTARHALITPRDQKAGKLTPKQEAEMRETLAGLKTWEGHITYLHTPGWSMERVIAQLIKLVAEQECDAVVLDYLEKASASKRQLQLFGTNTNQREADNVEQIKNFAESTGIPVLMIAQMSKAGKVESFDRVDRTAMRGAGEKSDKANVVVLLHRERIGENGYSDTVDVLVDKNTMGATGTLKQTMTPEFYSVGDPRLGLPILN